MVFLRDLKHLFVMLGGVFGSSFASMELNRFSKLGEIGVCKGGLSPSGFTGRADGIRQELLITLIVPLLF